MTATPRNRAALLLVGVVLGFSLAVLGGYRATAHNRPLPFFRFHPGVSPEGNFYPTFSALENSALAAAQGGRTVVIIGGNSILNGVGQSEGELWSRELQRQLGDRYAVVNLAFTGAYPSEAGALVAESLLRRGLPIVFVANTAPGPVARPYESIYAYLYWDAFYKHRLLANGPREAELAYRDQVFTGEAKARLRAARLAGRLDATLRFEEFWNEVACWDFFTVWSRVDAARFWLPRAKIPDRIPAAPPLEQRFQDHFAQEMEITRAFCAVYAESDGHDGWRATVPSALQTARDIDEIFVAPLRARMAILLTRNCPYYQERLTPSEQARDDMVFAFYQKLWQDHGITAVTVGSDFTPADYRDRAHFSAEGGRKLATIVAETVRRFPPP